MTFEEWMEQVVHGFEIVGVAILVAGSIAALAGYVLALARGRREGAFERVRQGVGRAILLGLEVLIIADIVLTITVEATVESALTLGLVVLVRTFLSFSLEIELEGALPWRRARRGADRPIEGDDPGHRVPV
jgi:uncharacterized membrane protein